MVAGIKVWRKQTLSCLVFHPINIRGPSQTKYIPVTNVIVSFGILILMQVHGLVMQQSEK